MPNFKNIIPLDLKLLKEKYDEKELQVIIDKIENEDYPVQYAIGNVEFLNTVIDVDERVLIPRFETELLVSKLKNYIIKYGLENGNVLDLCTGSGCIAIALKKAFPNIQIDACDKSEDALELAKNNAQKNNTDVYFYKQDILKNLDITKKYSIVVSNPPYVEESEYTSPNTKYEPRMALYPGKDSIIFYKKILDGIKNSGYRPKIISFEIGATQGQSIRDYALESYPDAQVEIEKDFNGFDRFVFIFLKSE